MFLSVKQGLDLIQLRLIFREMEGMIFLVKTGLRFRIKLRFRMNLGPTPHLIPCLFCLFRPSVGQIWLKV